MAAATITVGAFDQPEKVGGRVIRGPRADGPANVRARAGDTLRRGYAGRGQAVWPLAGIVPGKQRSQRNVACRVVHIRSMSDTAPPKRLGVRQVFGMISSMQARASGLEGLRAPGIVAQPESMITSSR